MSTRLALSILALVIVVAAVAYFFFMPKAAPALIDVVVQKPLLVAHGIALDKVELWAIPTGTNIATSSADFQLLGNAQLASVSASGTQTWTLSIPVQPLLITGVLAKGYAKGALVSEATLPIVGATDIYNALWAKKPDFLQRGTLVKDNPGFKSGIWYLSYERAGAPALSVELMFDAQSTCITSAARTVCNPASMAQGATAAVEGVREGSSTVLVQTMAL